MERREKRKKVILTKRDIFQNKSFMFKKIEIRIEKQKMIYCIIIVSIRALLRSCRVFRSLSAYLHY